LRYVCDVDVTQKTFDASAELGLSSEAQRMLHWRKAGLLYVLTFWLIRLVVGIRHLSKAKGSFEQVLLEIPSTVQVHAQAFPSALFMCEVLYITALIVGARITTGTIWHWKWHTRTRKMLRIVWCIVFLVPVFLLISFPYRNAVDWEAADGDMCREAVIGMQEKYKLALDIHERDERDRLFTKTAEKDYLNPHEGLDLGGV
jgi:hypothetical protein